MHFSVFYCLFHTYHVERRIDDEVEVGNVVIIPQKIIIDMTDEEGELHVAIGLGPSCTN